MGTVAHSNSCHVCCCFTDTVG